MIRRKHYIGLALVFLAFAASACQETEAVGEYDNWEARNDAFIDSIAKVASANADGKWKTILSFKLEEKDIDGNTTPWSNENYVYCHVEKSGEGACPLFTDTVLVNYRGRLIPTTNHSEGLIFDQSFKGELNSEVNIPFKTCPGAVVVGWSTVLQKMHVGDTWKVYIPAKLGYGTSSKGSIPAHSALLFDIDLLATYPVGLEVIQ